MGEYHHLACLRQTVQHPGQPVDPHRVHRLHRVVEDREPERACVELHPRDEQAQRQSMQLALRHDAERNAGVPVDGHVHDHLLGSEAHVLECDVGADGQGFPDIRDLGLDRVEALVRGWRPRTASASSRRFSAAQHAERLAVPGGRPAASRPMSRRSAATDRRDGVSFAQQRSGQPQSPPPPAGTRIRDAQPSREGRQARRSTPATLLPARRHRFLRLCLRLCTASAEPFR